MSAVCAMPTSTPTPAALVRSKTSTGRPTIRQQSARSCSINPLDFHRPRGGRIVRARSTPGISYNETQQQLLLDSLAVLQDEEAHPVDVCSEIDPSPSHQGTADPSQIAYSEDHFTLQPFPDWTLSSTIDCMPVGSYAAPNVDLLTPFFPPSVDFFTCSSPEVPIMSSGYGQNGSYAGPFSTGDPQSSQVQQTSVPAHSTPALTYATSYSSSPPTVSGSPALSQASAAFAPQTSLASTYHLPPASLAALELPRTTTAQGYQQPLTSPHAYTLPSYHQIAHQPGSPPPSYLPHPHASYGPSYPVSQTAYYPASPYGTYTTAPSTHYSYAYSSGYDQHRVTSHAGTSSETGGRRSHRGSTSEPDQTANSVASEPRAECWDHNCNGRKFSTFSNLLRHQRERSGSATKAVCPECGATFTRTTARNGHMRNGICANRLPRRSGGHSDLSSDGQSTE